MKLLRSMFLLAMLVTVMMIATMTGHTAAQTKTAKDPGPLTIKSQGSFFVGGENKTITQPGFGPNAPATSGDITVNQMYVQFQIPMKGAAHVPVVMVHGCCLSSKTWETTPDGRMGWSEYFVRKDRSVYLADQVSRARSGFDPTAFTDVGHSESGFFPEQAALINPAGIRGNISIEMPCVTNFSAAQIATLAKIPTLIMFGDHLNDMPAGGVANWGESFASCNTFVDQLKKAGGDAEMMHLPELGIKGNSHMLMQDRNSDQLADLVIGWIDRHVEKNTAGTR